MIKRGVLVKDALFAITSGNYGAACVIDDANKLLGIFTDGDLRRLIEKFGVNAFNIKIEDAMTISPESLAAEVMRLMERNEISVLIAVNNENIPVGMIHLHEILKAGIA